MGHLGLIEGNYLAVVTAFFTPKTLKSVSRGGSSSNIKIELINKQNKLYNYNSYVQQ